jgi:hypothetical protein
VTDVELQEIGVAEVVVRLVSVDPDDLLDARVLDQALDEESSPPAGDSGHQHAALSVRH